MFLSLALYIWIGMLLKQTRVTELFFNVLRPWTLSPELLLYRLFHERGVRVFDAQDVREHCTCSRERIEGIVKSFTPQERHDMVEDGHITVTCEYCSTSYRFAPVEFDPAA